MYISGMRVFAATAFIRTSLSAIEKLKGIRRRPAPKEIVPYTVWNRQGVSIRIMLYDIHDRRESLNTLLKTYPSIRESSNL